MKANFYIEWDVVWMLKCLQLLYRWLRFQTQCSYTIKVTANTFKKETFSNYFISTMRKHFEWKYHEHVKHLIFRHSQHLVFIGERWWSWLNIEVKSVETSDLCVQTVDICRITSWEYIFYVPWRWCLALRLAKWEISLRPWQIKPTVGHWTVWGRWWANIRMYLSNFLPNFNGFYYF